MAPQNMSDIIEAYLKSVLNRHHKIEIRRSEIAERFDCVPSQINYVINTRFTVQSGYLVESKRGGGGYIRIKKVKLLDETELLEHIIDVVGDSISEKDAINIIKQLLEEELISKREAKLVAIAVKKPILVGDVRKENVNRATMLNSMLKTLLYETPNN